MFKVNKEFRVYFGTSKNLKKNLLNLNEMLIYNYIFLESK